MYYGEILKKLQDEDKNPVNRMYLHEISMKWQVFQQLAEDYQKAENKELVAALNEFITSLSNRKYKYNPSSRNGFQDDSPLFSARYLDDLVTVLIQRTEIQKKIGVSWGYQAFSIHLKFNPPSLMLMGINPMFEQNMSVPVLSLVQKMDFQFRITGKRNYRKYRIAFPLIQFHDFKNLNELDYIRVDHYAKLAKETFSKSRSIVISETLEDRFVPNIRTSSFDAIFVLKKQYRSEGSGELSLQTVNLLEERIRELLNERPEESLGFKNEGIIEE
ncbi:MAG: hypothetical protein JW784_06070 [Candidatus Cloacimonetes bacterium]|nr:hypothetical protein [Candidatus Cloacimonadota bacterium]